MAQVGAAALGIGAGVALAGVGGAALTAAINGKCVNLPGINIGCNADTDISISIKSVTNIVSTAIQTNVSNSDQPVINIQNQKVTLSGAYPCKNTQITQSVKINNELKADIRQSVISDISSNLKSVLSTKIDNYTKQVSELLGPQSAAKTKIKLDEAVATMIKTVINTENLTTIKQSVFNFQNQEIVIINDKPGCENLVISQSAIIDQMSQILAVQAAGSMFNNATVNEIYNDIVAKTDQEGKGLNSIIDSIISFMKTWGLIIGVVLIALIIGAVMFFRSGGTISRSGIGGGPPKKL